MGQGRGSALPLLLICIFAYLSEMIALVGFQPR